MPKAKCPSCATVVTYVAGYDPICPNCGFRGSAPEPVRPPAQWQSVQESAHPIHQAPHAPVQGKQQGLAIAALVGGLLSFPIPPLSLVAIILGAVAMNQADRDPATYGGKGMAVAGLVLGIIVAVFWLLLLSVFDSMWDDFW